MSGAQLTVVLWAEGDGEVSRASGLSTPPSVLRLRSVPGSAEVMPSWQAPASASVRLFFFFFLPHLEGMENFPDQGSGPLQWKPGVLISGLPGKFLPLPLGSNSSPHMGRWLLHHPWISSWQILLSALPSHSLLSSRQTGTLHLLSSKKPSGAN